MKTILHTLFTLLLTAMITAEVNAATITITSNTNWSATAITAGDDVIVKNGATLTVDVTNAQCANIQLGVNGGASSGNGTLSYSASSSKLTMTGEITFGDGGQNGYLDMTNGGELICTSWSDMKGSFTPGSGEVQFTGTFTLQNDLAFDDFNDLTINGGTVTLGKNPTNINGELNITSGSFELNNNDMTIDGDMSMTAGSFDPNNRSVAFEGSSTQQITGEIDFYQFEIDNSAGVTLNDDITVSNQMTFTDGVLDVNGNILELGESAVTTGGGASSYVDVDDGTGEYRKLYNSNGPFVYDVGDSDEYAPMTITINVGTTFGGSDYIGVRQTDAMHPNMSGTDYLTRYYSLSAGNFTSIDYDFSFTYATDIADVNGTEASLSAVVWDGAAWSVYDVVNTGSNLLRSTSGITVLPNGHSITGGSGALLPVELSEFDANLSGNSVLVDWATMSEKDNDYFAVERSEDGNEFEEIGIVAGAGDASTKNNYSFLDDEPVYGASYYRLRQVDFDGNISFSDIRVVNYDLFRNSESSNRIFPNPVAVGSSLNIQSDAQGQMGDEFLVVLYDITGREIVSKVVIQESSKVTTALDINNDIPAGIYMVVGSSSNKVTFKQKILVTDNTSESIGYNMSRR